MYECDQSEVEDWSKLSPEEWNKAMNELLEELVKNPDFVEATKLEHFFNRHKP